MSLLSNFPKGVFPQHVNQCRFTFTFRPFQIFNGLEKITKHSLLCGISYFLRSQDGQKSRLTSRVYSAISRTWFLRPDVDTLTLVSGRYSFKISKVVLGKVQMRKNRQLRLNDFWKLQSQTLKWLQKPSNASSLPFNVWCKLISAPKLKELPEYCILPKVVA